jgi:hypothetical protein
METINLVNLDGETMLSLSSVSKGDVLNKLSKCLFNKDSAFNNCSKYRFNFNGERTMYPVDSQLFHRCFVQSEITVDCFLTQSHDLRYDDIDQPCQRDVSPFEHEVASRFTADGGNIVQVTSLTGWIGENANINNSEVTVLCGDSQLRNIAIADIPALIDALKDVMHESTCELEKISSQKNKKYTYNTSAITAISSAASA